MSPAPDCKILSVGFDFLATGSEAILKSLYALPATVENVSFTGKVTHFSGMSAASFRRDNDNGQGVRCLDGTLKFRLATDTHIPQNVPLALARTWRLFQIQSETYQLSGGPPG